MRAILRNTLLATVLSVGFGLLGGPGIAAATSGPPVEPGPPGTNGNAAGGDGGDSGNSGDTGGNVNVNVCRSENCTIVVTSGDSGNTGPAGAGGGAVDQYTPRPGNHVTTPPPDTTPPTTTYPATTPGGDTPESATDELRSPCVWPGTCPTPAGTR